MFYSGVVSGRSDTYGGASNQSDAEKADMKSSRDMVVSFGGDALGSETPVMVEIHRFTA
jgi:hypothetical protein